MDIVQNQPFRRLQTRLQRYEANVAKHTRAVSVTGSRRYWPRSDSVTTSGIGRPQSRSHSHSHSHSRSQSRSGSSRVRIVGDKRSILRHNHLNSNVDLPSETYASNVGIHISSYAVVPLATILTNMRLGRARNRPQSRVIESNSSFLLNQHSRQRRGDMQSRDERQPRVLKCSLGQVRPFAEQNANVIRIDCKPALDIIKNASWTASKLRSCLRHNPCEMPHESQAQNACMYLKAQRIPHNIGLEPNPAPCHDCPRPCRPATRSRGREKENSVHTLKTPHADLTQEPKCEYAIAEDRKNVCKVDIFIPHNDIAAPHGQEEHPGSPTF